MFLSKKKKSGPKVLFGLVKYISVDPKDHSRISIKLDFKPNLGMGFFFGAEEVLFNKLERQNKQFYVPISNGNDLTSHERSTFEIKFSEQMLLNTFFRHLLGKKVCR